MYVGQERPPEGGRATTLSTLPSEILLNVIQSLSCADDVQRLTCTCRSIRSVAKSDAAWRPIVVRSLKRSPPPSSHNITHLRDIPAPWDPSFGLVSVGRNPAQREKWFAGPYGRSQGDRGDRISSIDLSIFPGATSFQQVYWTFVRPFARLLGWWMGDVHSYGMTIRIVFDPQHALDGPDGSTRSGPAFLCQKLHVVNRLYGMGSNADQWRNASGFHAVPISNDGASIEANLLSIDVSVPGVKVEPLWEASWQDCQAMCMGNIRHGKDIARLRWRTQDASMRKAQQYAFASTEVTQQRRQTSILRRAHSLATQMVFGVNADEHERETGLDVDAEGDARGEDGRAEEEMQEDEVFGLGAWPLHIQRATRDEQRYDQPYTERMPLLPPAIQQRSGGHLHTVYLTSGAVCTTPLRSQQDHGESQEENDRVTLLLRPQRLYEGSNESAAKAFGLKMSNFLPLPPLEFPSPALLPLIRDLEEADLDEDDEERRRMSAKAESSSSTAFETFLTHGIDFETPVLQMEPCPPYLPWPHLSQPLASGVKFVPIRSPPRQSLISGAERYEDERGDVRYRHSPPIAPHFDPAREDFDWSLMNGLYSMTYGPWGQELIYVRTRILTVHDFSPDDLRLSDTLAPTLFKNDRERSLPRPTGPHGQGHRWQEGFLGEGFPNTGSSLCEGLHWRPEPYIDLSDLELPPEQTAFIRPGCRVIEGVKCTGDANVPRGTISFRAFSRGSGQGQDECITWFAPDSAHARHAPWNGARSRPFCGMEYDDDGVHHPYVSSPSSFIDTDVRSSQTHPEQRPTPGRILDCATGRLAMEGFVNAGCWRRCSVKITSLDEINVFWHALHKVAVAHRLLAC